MLTLERVESIIKAIQYKPNWSFRVEKVYDLCQGFTQSVIGFNIFSDFYRLDTVTGLFGSSEGTRAWFVESWRDPSYVVRTCFMAALANEEHECRENFKYDGKTLFGPHESYLEI